MPLVNRTIGSPVNRHLVSLVVGLGYRVIFVSKMLLVDGLIDRILSDHIVIFPNRPVGSVTAGAEMLPNDPFVANAVAFDHHGLMDWPIANAGPIFEDGLIADPMANAGKRCWFTAGRWKTTSSTMSCLYLLVRKVTQQKNND